VSTTLEPTASRLGGSPPLSVGGSRMSRLGLDRHMLPLLVLVILLAHLPYLLGIFDPNPLLQDSGLALHLKAGLLPGGDTIDPNAGFTSQALGHRAMVDWLHGHIPWWNPFEGAGSPLAGELNSAALFPLTVLLLLSSGQIWFYLILVLVSAVSTFLLFRRLDLNPWICFAGGLAFGLNGTAAWFRFSASNSICFLPLLLLAVEGTRADAALHRTRAWALVAVAIALSIYAGFPESAYLDGLLAVVWTLARLPGLTLLQMRHFLQRLIAGAVLGLLLAAPLLIAVLDYFPRTYIGAHSGAYAHASLTRDGLTGLVFPYFFGPIFGFTGYPGGAGLVGFWGSVGGYLTTSLMFLALAGLFGSRYRALRIALAVWSLLILGKMFGITAVTAALNAIPGIHYIAFYRYSTPGLEFAVTTLAVLGVHDLTQQTRRWRRTTLGLGLATLLGALAVREGLPLDRSLLGAPHHRLWLAASIAWGVGIVLALALFSLLKSQALRRGLLAALLGLDSLAMFMVPEFSAPRAGSIDMTAVHFLQQHIGRYRFYTLGPLAPDYGSYFGVASLATNDLPDPKLWNEIVTQKLDPNSNAILFTGGVSLDPNGLTPEEAFVKYIRNYEALGDKYLLIPRTQPVPILSGPRQLRPVYRDALLEILKLPDPRPYFSTTDRGCSLETTSRTSLSVTCKRSSVLVRNELFMPGWTATANQKSIPIQESALHLQTIRVGPGRTSLAFSFSPPHSRVAEIAMLIGVVILILLLYLGRPRRPNYKLHVHRRTHE
jgi:hypothetical protein